MSKVVWNLAKLLIQFGIVWSCFQYLSGFSDRQSVALALLVVGSYNWLRSLEAADKRAREFRPYIVSIEVTTVHDLLFHYN